MIEKIGGRKAAACLIGLVAVVGCYLAKGSIPAELNEMVKYLVATYLAGNIAADVVSSVTTVKNKAAEVAINSAVTTASIADGAVTEAKLNDPFKEQTVTAINDLAGKLNNTIEAVKQQDKTIQQIIETISPA